MAKKKDVDHQTVSTRILIGLIIGALIGVVFQFWGANPVREWLLVNVIDPTGQVFLRSLFMVVVPLVFASLSAGVARLGSPENIRRLGWRIFAFYIATSMAAIIIGQLLVSVIRPGTGLEVKLQADQIEMSNQVASLVERSQQLKGSIWPGILSAIVPTNVFKAMVNGDMLAIIFVSILFGITLAVIGKAKSETAVRLMEIISAASIKIVGWIMRLAPYAVAALMISAVTRFGFGIMGNVVMYVGVVIFGFIVHVGITYPILLKTLVRYSTIEFFKRAFSVQATAFSTSSSNATIPATIYALEERFGVPERITTFCVPLGATINMDGTALFEMVAAIFIAQVFGVHIGLEGQITLVILILLTSIGVAGVPGGSVPILMSAMASVGIPPEGIALVLGVDRLLDMFRTAVNVTGDMVGTLFLARSDGIALEGEKEKIWSLTVST